MKKYILNLQIGCGGMGEVWSGRDRQTNTPVAVKLISQHRSSTPMIRAAFRREAHLAASLRHPGIVQILDAGETAEGVLYMVMERLSGATLASPPPGGLRWRVLQRELLDVLRALAYAHAHGVLHCDIKPSNILRTSPSAVSRVKLADFGLARRYREHPHPLSGAGSHHYMAPEQRLKSWHDFGPWTDLYALGCTAWHLLCGEPVFNREQPIHQQLSQPLPRFTPLIAVPDGLGEWLTSLLVADPRFRVQHAADALAALECLSGPIGHRSPAAAIRIREQVTLTDLTVDEVAPLPALPAAVRPAPPMVIPSLPLLAPERPAPMMLPHATPTFRLHTAAPLIGRRAEQAALWRCVRSRVAGDAMRVVRLEGPVGSGRTRLATWLAASARQHGVQVFDTAIPSVRGLLSEAFGCTQTDRRQTMHRLQRTVPDIAGPLTDILHSTASVTTPGALAVIRQALAARCRLRPTVLILRSLHEAPDVMALLRHLQAHPLPLLVVATTLSRIELPTAASERIVLGPLSRADMAATVRAHARLPAATLEHIVSAARGNPGAALSALELVLSAGTPPLRRTRDEPLRSK